MKDEFEAHGKWHDGAIIRHHSVGARELFIRTDDGTKSFEPWISDDFLHAIRELFDVPGRQRRRVRVHPDVIGPSRTARRRRRGERFRVFLAHDVVTVQLPETVIHELVVDVLYVQILDAERVPGRSTPLALMLQNSVHHAVPRRHVAHARVVPERRA